MAAHTVLTMTARILIAATTVLVLLTVFTLPQSVPSGMRTFRLNNFSIRPRKLYSEERDLMNNRKNAMMKRGGNTGISWRSRATDVGATVTATSRRSSGGGGGVISGSEADNRKIVNLVNRILEVEKSIVNISQGPVDARHICQLEQLMMQMKLVKTLFEKSVFLMKLADLASRGRGSSSSSWIAWDRLEPATRDLENNVKSLRLREDRGRPTFVCFTKDGLVVASSKPNTNWSAITLCPKCRKQRILKKTHLLS